MLQTSGCFQKLTLSTGSTVTTTWALLLFPKLEVLTNTFIIFSNYFRLILPQNDCIYVISKIVKPVLSFSNLASKYIITLKKTIFK